MSKETFFGDSFAAVIYLLDFKKHLQGKLRKKKKLRGKVTSKTYTSAL